MSIITMIDVQVVPDLTKYDTAKGHINHLIMVTKTYYDFVRLLRKKYTNYLSVGYRWKKKNFPITAVLKDGTQKRFISQQEIWLDLRNISYDNEKNIVMIEGMKFRGGMTKGDIINIFINKEYEFLPLDNRDVIDIGSNIADSSIYFIKRGARKVYAVEPNRDLYELANENISLNSMSDRIETIFAGCSSFPSSNSYPPFFTLEEIVDHHKVNPDLLKIDCEGCEYDVILNSSDKILRSFNVILVEYHYGYKKIKNRLEKCGFVTKVSGPTYYPQSIKPNTQNTKFSNRVTQVEKVHLFQPFIGFVYATRSSL